MDAGIGAAGWIGPVVLLVSALLTAGYLLPVTVHGFFPGNDYVPEKDGKCEPGLLMLVPVIAMALIALFFGVFPGFIENGISAIISEIAL